MKATARFLLVGCLASALGSTLLAQRGVGGRVGVPLPSSTAIGAGALSIGPSTTARSSQAAIARPGYRSGFNATRSGYLNGRNRLPYAFLTPYYYPFGFDDPNAGVPYDGPGYDPNVQASMMAQGALFSQMQKLTAEVDQLRSAQVQPAMAVPVQPDSQTPQAPIALVLRNGQTIQVQNYAVMNGIFWDFTKQPVKKIPITAIDVNASARATEAQGGEFPQLTPSGQ
jgi:hypothetical protein